MRCGGPVRGIAERHWELGFAPGQRRDFAWCFARNPRAILAGGMLETAALVTRSRWFAKRKKGGDMRKLRGTRGEIHANSKVSFGRPERIRHGAEIAF
jgi:hypothetical protein